MPVTPPKDYYNRFDPEKRYEEHLFLAGRPLQSAELNELQHHSHARLKGVADAIFKDGDILRDCDISVNNKTGEVQLSSGAVYLRGAVRGVPPASFTIPTSGTVIIGVRLSESIITEQEDPELRDPAVGLRNAREPGALRLRIDPCWGWDGDGSGENLYPIYWVDEGYLRAKEPPPTIDMLSLSLARYDRDSAGGTYVIDGLTVQVAEDLNGDHKQAYTLMEGRARCYGFPLELRTSRRIIYDAEPVYRRVTTEPHQVTREGDFTIATNRTPIKGVTEVQTIREKTVKVVHGAVRGSTDPLPDITVLTIVEVKQGDITYLPGTHYGITSNMVDWSPGGNTIGGDGSEEPAPGSSYYVTYRYLSTESPSLTTMTSVSVAGTVDATGTPAVLVVGQPVLITYDYYVPRIDVLCLNREGATIWVRGVPSDHRPHPPEIANDLLPLARITQSWDARRKIELDGARMVPMNELATIQGKLDRLLFLAAEERLKADANLRDTSIKRSILVDPFVDDTIRDAGISQSGAIVDGFFQLAIDVTPYYVSQDTLYDYLEVESLITEVEQPQRTSTMLVCPYLRFVPVPGRLALNPATDHFVEIKNNTVWGVSGRTALTSPFPPSIPPGFISLGKTNTLIDSQRTERPHLRAISVVFVAQGFGPGEEVDAITFDGVQVTPDPPPPMDLQDIKWAPRPERFVNTVSGELNPPQQSQPPGTSRFSDFKLNTPDVPVHILP